MDTKKLRQKILDLAIRGKLVPQDPNDEPASVLLERIRVEKERLIKEGKIKRGKKSSSDTPHYKNVPPFVLPDRWLWVSLEDFVFAVTDGDHQPPPQSVSGIPFLVISDVNTGHISFDKARYTDEDYYKGLPEIRKAAKGDILFTVTGSYGIVIPVETERRFCFQRHIGLIKTITSSSWLAMVLQSDYVQSYCDKVATGTAQKTISLGHLRDLLIPIPPKEEQGRITKELQKWLGEVKNIATESDSLLSIISKTKSRILDLAIHGKLVSQDPNDEPAIELLKRINPKFTPCDNAQYPNIPSSWVTCTVKDVFQINPKTNASDNLDAGFVPMSSICDQYNNAFTFETRTWSDIKRGYTHFKDGDIAVAKISPCLENRKSVVFHDLPNGIGSGTTELNVFRSDIIYPLFGLYFFKSQHFISNCVGTFNGVVGQQRVATKIIEEIDYFLPPYQEQIRIVGKIKELFAVLDEIQESIEA